nr:uncharacterized protein LOC129481614 [Symphalangus syndactylus]
MQERGVRSWAGERLRAHAGYPCRSQARSARVEGHGPRTLRRCLPARLRQRGPGRSPAGSGGAAGRGTTREPLTKQLWEGRRPLPPSAIGPRSCLSPRMGGGGQWRAQTELELARARGSASVGLVGGCGERGNGDAGGRASSETFTYTRPELPPLLKSSRLPRLQQRLRCMFLRP